ncbi:DNA mismatch repair protein MutS [Roseivirga sp. E12]|uniref:MutS-related protein n=1 Tax=Roseivirga sp. E12 TaxID=2819237 RepID=UPI001ABD0FEB|nr:DNA mismatch repair protein MutS [Roseivirga sp. E12]MBO3699949.1 DNA mismatch repair protein MutS [Roseivirga sp. E12]
MKNSIQSTFEKRQADFQKEASEAKSNYTSLSWVRVALFVFSVVSIVSLVNNKNGEAAGAVLIIAFIIYLVLLKRHSVLRFKMKQSKALEEINSHEVKRLHNDFNGLDEGRKYYQAIHPYHEDLDVFGKHSLFQLINRTSTFIGEKVLANWLSNRGSTIDILSRQESVKELTPDIEFRQQFQAYGMVGYGAEIDHQPLLNWLREDSKVKNTAFYKVALAVLPLATIGTIIISSMGYLQSGVPILLAFINLGVLAGLFNKVQDISKKTEQGYKSLNSLRFHIDMIEKADFKSRQLKALKETVEHGNVKASKIIKELQLVLDNLQNRSNLLYIIFDVLLLLDVYWYIRVNAWKRENQADIEKWFQTIGELDVLISIAGFAYSNPDFSYPTISEEHFDIKAEGLGHPLINAQNRVINNFEFHGQGGICLITGSNMSGKSTFLRTVGVNCTLGLMGAPVCAKTMTVSDLRIFTSMRSQDDLEENVSSFYAELKRLKQLLASINDETPVLFMIDEVLKGTNSEDRHKGALALIKQLNLAYAFGFVSTHDIELGNITNELKGVKNYSFNSEIIGDEIKFDYTLTPGICKSFNATKLMQKMGIQIPD